MKEVYTRFIGDFDNIKLLAVDTETLDMDQDDLFTTSSEKYTLDIFSVSGRKGDTYYYGAFPKEMFKEFFYKNIGKKWVFHNAGYDLKVIRKYGLAWDSVLIEDTMVMAQLLGHTKWGYGLKDLRVSELGLPKRKGYEDIDRFNEEEYYTYAALDTLDTLKLYEALMPRIIEEKLVEAYAIERDVVYVVSDMEWEGVGIDVEKMASTKPFLQGKIAPIEDALNILTHYVDINSPKQLQKFFYIDRGVEPKPEWLTTAGKNKRNIRNKKDRSEEEERNFQAGKYDETIYDFSVGVDTLTDLMERDDDIANIASLILEYRKYTKLISTFIDGFIPKLLKGRIHGRLLPFGTDSGRFCIGRGTKISMPSEEKNIEDVNIGDLVYCYDDAGKLAIRKVTNKWNTGVKKVCRSFYRSKGNHKVISLVSTYDHKIRKADLSYVEVQKLVKNERVLHLTEEKYVFIGLEDAGELECWDIEVEDFHNFIANEVCVHNSSKDPNLQNIAADDYDDSGNSIRGFFIPRKGRKFITADYSQVELRMTGLCSGDPIITKAYVSGEDMHSTTAKNLNIDRKPSKCLAPSTLINYNGSISYVGDVCTYEDLVPISGETILEGKSIPVISTYKGQDTRYLLVTRRGVIVCNKEHEFLTLAGDLKQLKDLKKGEALAKPVGLVIPQKPAFINYNFFKEESGGGAILSLNSDWAYFAGLFEGDGSCNEKTISIAIGSYYGNEYNWKYLITQAAIKTGIPITREKNRDYLVDNGRAAKSVSVLYIGSVKVRRFFDAIGLTTTVDQKNCKSHRIPLWVMQNTENIINYLSGLFDTDGTVEKQTGAISIVAKEPLIIGDVATALSALGLFNFTISVEYNKTYNRDYYVIRLNSGESIKFYQMSTMRCPWKVQILQDRLKSKTRRAPQNVTTENEVLKILELDYGTVCDINVGTNDHLHITNNFITHNCVNFGILYGMQGPTLRAGLKKAGAIVALADAERFIKKYWETYTKVKAMFDYVTEQIKKLGYVRTISGRKRRSYEITEGTLKGLRNSVLQGGAGELMKVALVRLWKNMDRKRAAIVLTVHDELTVEADEEYVEECSKIVKWAMEEILPTNIKFCCNMNTGYSWAESK